MSTWAAVGIVKGDKIIGRLIWHDGYPTSLGVHLLENEKPHMELLDVSLLDFSDYRTSDIQVWNNLDEFLKCHSFMSYHYLYKDGQWYIGSFSYQDGWVRSLETNEKVRKEYEECFKVYEDFTPLRPKFKITPRIVRDYEYIEDGD